MGAIALYWLGRFDGTGLTRPFLLGAVGGVPLGAILGFLLAPAAAATERPILVAAAAALMGGGAGLVGLFLVPARESAAVGEWSILDVVLSIVLLLPFVLIAWAVAMPFALASVFVGRRLVAAGLTWKRVCLAAFAILGAAAVTAFDAFVLRR